MPSCSERCRLRIAGLILLSLLASAGAGSSQAEEFEEFAIIVSQDVPVTDVSMNELQRLLRFRKRHWSSGHPVRIMLSTNDIAAHSFVLDELYGLDYPALRRLILQRIYQGEIDNLPKVVASYEDAIGFVGASEGLLAIVPADLASEASVTTLSVDGKRPGTAGYPLRRPSP